MYDELKKLVLINSVRWRVQKYQYINTQTSSQTYTPADIHLEQILLSTCHAMMLLRLIRPKLFYWCELTQLEWNTNQMNTTYFPISCKRTIMLKWVSILSDDEIPLSNLEHIVMTKMIIPKTELNFKWKHNDHGNEKQIRTWISS